MKQRDQQFLGDWHKLIEDFQTSSRSFYAAVTAAVERRKIPGLKTRSVIWNEGGAISPRREYLRLTDGRVAFDLCAAPFGTGFFFSWWLVEVQARWVVLYALGFAGATNLLKVGIDDAVVGAYRLEPRLGLWRSWLFYNPTWLTSRLPWPWGPLRWPETAMGLVDLGVAILIVFWLVALLSRLGRRGAEAALQRIPVFGRAYRWLFEPVTYYRLDTAIMLRSAVHAAVLEVIDGLTVEKGLRALADEDRKPVLEKLA